MRPGTEPWSPRLLANTLPSKANECCGFMENYHPEYVINLYSSHLLRLIFWKTELLMKKRSEEGPHGIVGNLFDWDVVVSEFELFCSLSDIYSGESNEPSYPPSYGLNSTTTVL